MPTAKLLKRLKSDSIHQSVKKFQLLKGYCKKQSSKGKWQKRYFEAKDNYLNYSSNDKSKKVLGSIDLRTVGKITKVGGNRLSLQLEDRVYTIEILQSNQCTLLILYTVVLIVLCTVRSSVAKEVKKF